MRTHKILLLVAIMLSCLWSCSEDAMDEVNRELNSTTDMGLDLLIPDILLKSAFESTGTDIAWYTSVYIELNTGTWNQMNEADVRTAQEASTRFNGSWSSLYDIMNICKEIIERTDPGSEDEGSYLVRGIAEIMMAYNLAIATDGWGEIPYTEAFKGAENLQPTYENQSVIYGYIDDLLDDGIADLAQAIPGLLTDYIYGGDPELWAKAAWSLKARYAMRLSNVNSNAAANALTAIPNGFSSADDAFMFDLYTASATAENPWYQFYNDRSHHSTSLSLYNRLIARNDPRMDVYFSKLNDTIRPAPNGTATLTQGGIYSQSLITINGRTAPTPLMTYHELLFIKAEAEFMTGAAGWQATLQQAIEANFVFHGLTAGQGTAYYTTEVAPLLTSGNELDELITQKYIAFFEHESIEAYNDYRRTGIPEMTNPNNDLQGFVWRFARPTTETSSNSANVPEISVFDDKTWWAGGTEKL